MTNRIVRLTDEEYETHKIGTPVGPSHWLRGEPSVRRQEVKTYRETMACIKEDCDGEMVYTGCSWPTGTPGYHHKCDKCGEVVAVKGATFPRIVTDPPHPKRTEP